MTSKTHEALTPPNLLAGLLNRITSLILVAATPVLSLQTTKTAVCAEEKRTPNVVIIFIDDLGYGDIGPYGATKQKTPNLDRMAQEGMKLTSFYAAPVCSVSRAQLMTGCYGARVSVPGVYGPGSKNGLNLQELTIAERLKPLGYATKCVGKWHLGDQPEFLPTKQGFDHYFGIPYSNDMQRRSSETGQNVVPLLRDDRVIELLSDEAQSRIVERYTDEATSFIRANAAQPFFLYLPHTAVHTPIWPGEKFRGKSANGRFGDWVEEVDWSVGKVLDTLRELKLAERTLVLFTSDNGPWLVKGADGGSALPLRGGKGSTWEGGVRVPTVAWWPGKIPAASVCDAVLGTIDVTPTVVALTGGEIPAEPVIDGRDASAQLFGKSQTSPRDAHYYFAGYNLQAVRQGKWKLAVANQPDASAKKGEAEALKNPRLYDLDAEIGERTNLAAQHPDVVDKLQAKIDRMQSEIGGNDPTQRRPAGQAENPKTLYPTESNAKPKDSKAKDSKQKKQSNGSTPIETTDLAKLKIGESVSGGNAPQVEDKALTVSCKVETQSANGVIVAHGGASTGYALHLEEGKMVFTTRIGNQTFDVETPFPKSPNSHRVVAELTKEGVIRLQIDGGAWSEKKTSGLLTRQPKESFCVGVDDGVAVTNYRESTPFAGKITDLRVTAH